MGGKQDNAFFFFFFFNFQTAHFQCLAKFRVSAITTRMPLSGLGDMHHRSVTAMKCQPWFVIHNKSTRTGFTSL